MKGVYVVLPLWGEAYVRRWIEISLPSLLAPGNLPALAAAHSTKLLLYTTQADLPAITAAPAVAALRRVCGLRLIPFAASVAEFHGTSTNIIMTTLHNRGLAQAWQDDHGVVFLVGDVLVADGTLRSVVRAVAAGRRALLTQGVQAAQEAIAPLVAAAGRGPDGALSLAPRRLARIALDTMHWSARLQLWTAPRFTAHPSMIYWPLETRALLMRCFHYFPLFIHPERPCQAGSTIDNDFVDKALARPEDCAAIEDSDDGLLLDVLDPARAALNPGVPFPANPAFVAAWCRLWTTPFTRALAARHRFWIHDGVPPAERQAVDAESDRAIAEILDLYARGEARARGAAAS